MPPEHKTKYWLIRFHHNWTLFSPSLAADHITIVTRHHDAQLVLHPHHVHAVGVVLAPGGVAAAQLHLEWHRAAGQRPVQPPRLPPAAGLHHDGPQILPGAESLQVTWQRRRSYFLYCKLFCCLFIKQNDASPYRYAVHAPAKQQQKTNKVDTTNRCEALQYYTLLKTDTHRLHTDL